MIAHEFSHVLNGDMRLNVQLMGWLFGLFVVALIGRTLLRYRAAGGRKAAAALLLAGARRHGPRLRRDVLAGRLLQAAVSRQRERLADASAVQFTRNPDGLEGALLKIAGSATGSKLECADAEQVAHMLFAPGVKRCSRRIRRWPSASASSTRTSTCEHCQRCRGQCHATSRRTSRRPCSLTRS